MNTVYRERLLPKWWVFVFITSLIAMLSIAYGAAISALVGWLMFLGITALTSLAMFFGSPVIAVSDVLEVAHARLPLQYVDAVQVLSSEQTRDARSRRVDARNFVLVKSWAASQSVLVTLNDPNDPHPAWLISSRHPAELMSAISSSAASVR
ncbi:MAG: DUF3093 domain-containing protein [Actinomycetota bacterium]|nr:DUF3093 domain-containing protein [Actinomycetota bacterium]